VREFVRLAFLEAGIEVVFTGSNEKEKGIIKKITDPSVDLQVGQEVVVIDPTYYRPTEVDVLIGDPSKAQEQLGWAPSYDLESLIKEMVQADLQHFRKEKALKDSGFYINNQFE
jgi:GDPmannose 4,6-dehydratase